MLPCFYYHLDKCLNSLLNLNKAYMFPSLTGLKVSVIRHYLNSHHHRTLKVPLALHGISCQQNSDHRNLATQSPVSSSKSHFLIPHQLLFSFCAWLVTTALIQVWTHLAVGISDLTPGNCLVNTKQSWIYTGRLLSQLSRVWFVLLQPVPSTHMVHYLPSALSWTARQPVGFSLTAQWPFQRRDSGNVSWTEIKVNAHNLEESP